MVRQPKSAVFWAEIKVRTYRTPTLNVYAFPVCDVIIVSTISRMLRTVATVFRSFKRSLVIVSILALLLKAVESFLETSQCALKNTTAWMYRKIQIARCERSKFNPELAKIRI